MAKPQPATHTVKLATKRGMLCVSGTQEAVKIFFEDEPHKSPFPLNASEVSTLQNAIALWKSSRGKKK